MFKALLAPLLAFSLAIPSPDQLFPWRFFGPTVIEQTSSAVVRITASKEVETFFGTVNANVVCSGFVIAPQRVLTAQHCVADNMQADGKKVVVLKTDEFLDLALLYVKGLQREPLTIGNRTPELEEMLTAVGYAEGFTKLTVMTVQVKIVDYTPWPEVPPSTWVMPTYVGGMSGGPVVDASGAVVSIVQAGTLSGSMGFGVGTQLIHGFLVGTN